MSVDQDADAGVYYLTTVVHRNAEQQLINLLHYRGSMVGAIRWQPTHNAGRACGATRTQCGATRTQCD